MCIPQAQIEETFAQKPELFGSGFFVLMGRAPANDLSWAALVYLFKLGFIHVGACAQFVEQIVSECGL